MADLTLASLGMKADVLGRMQTPSKREVCRWAGRLTNPKRREKGLEYFALPSDNEFATPSLLNIVIPNKTLRALPFAFGRHHSPSYSDWYSQGQDVV